MPAGTLAAWAWKYRLMPVVALVSSASTARLLSCTVEPGVISAPPLVTNTFSGMLLPLPSLSTGAADCRVTCT